MAGSVRDQVQTLARLIDQAKAARQTVYSALAA